jgi:GxxExxY protein
VDAKKSWEGKKMNMHEFRGRESSGVDPEVEDLANAAIGAAVEVHKVLGPGLPEHVYRQSMSIELTLRGIPHEVEARVPVYYKGVLVGEGRVDILVGQRLVLEFKVVEVLADVHRAQVIAYLQALKLQLGLLINFNIAILKDGVKRVVLTS